MVNFNTDSVSIKKIEIKRPVVKDGQVQIKHEIIEYTNDQEEINSNKE